MKFGFLAHPVNLGQRNEIRAGVLLAGALAERTGRPAASRHLHLPAFADITSAAGAHCTGEVRYLPNTAEELLAGRGAAAGFVVDQVRQLAAGGADLVGLGGATSILGGRGVHTQQQVDIPLTSGNSLTTHAAHELVRTVLAQLGDADEPVGIVGFPGAIGLAMARLLVDDGLPVVLVCRKGRVRPQDLREELPAAADATITDDVADCLRQTRLIVAASSAGGVLDPAAFRPGTIVVDVALPRDVRPGSSRHDILVLDGGLVSATDRVRVDGLDAGPTEQLNGCLAETIVLALDGRADSYSLGRELDVRRIREIGAIAARHGFVTAPPASGGRLVPLERIAEVRGAARSARSRFAANVNPPLADLYAAHGMDRVFTGGHGATLTTADGTDYLDFVAGYGCLNLGHNHPAATGAVQRFLASGEPTFVQYTSIPARTAELAERLCAITPGRLERVFFGNSGAEAVEAALKLARAATGRTRFVYAENSYHGKTFGALSVTGRTVHTGPFGPLVPDCVAVPFGDEQALRDAIGGAAAFVVEPVQGEGGVIVPPPGYLAAAARLCREAGALLIVDEIQTGLGRTGTMFASDGVEADVLCLAKSLSGGLVPISATLATAEVWDAAYGTSSGAMLHTSTFGGGNLASAVALATVDTLVAEDLPGRAARLGARLRHELAEACAPFEFVSEVRGIGLMNAIAFDGGFEGAAGAMADDLLTRLPGNLHALSDTLPDTVRAALRAAGSEVERALGDLRCLRFVGALGRDHRILTFVTANSNRVVRIQPPLVITDADVDRFVKATRSVCESLDTGL